MKIQIRTTDGARFVSADDEARAHAAATLILMRHDCAVIPLGLVEPDGPLANVWNAANIALTLDWHDPNGAYCDVYLSV